MPILLYADSNYQVHLNSNNKFNFGVQVGNQNTWGMANTVPELVGYGGVNSYLGGAKIAYSYDEWFKLSYLMMVCMVNRVHFMVVAFISPYTFYNR